MSSSWWCTSAAAVNTLDIIIYNICTDCFKSRRIVARIIVMIHCTTAAAKMICGSHPSQGLLAFISSRALMIHVALFRPRRRRHQQVAIGNSSINFSAQQHYVTQQDLKFTTKGTPSQRVPFYFISPAVKRRGSAGAAFALRMDRHQPRVVGAEVALLAS